jgi:hypothetical protein
MVRTKESHAGRASTTRAARPMDEIARDSKLTSTSLHAHRADAQRISTLQAAIAKRQ